MRGHASIQGSTDIPTFYNMLPTYLPQPNVFQQHGTIEEYLHTETPTTGWWNNMPKYFISLLKAWYGENARADNEWGYQHIPKLTGDVSQLPMTLSMIDGVTKGQFILGQNPVVGAVNSDLVERGLSRLDWLVVRDFAMTETANFWQKGRLVQRGELMPADIGAEIFFLPIALSGEKDGTVTNTVPPDTMARYGSGGAGRQPVGSLVHLPSWQTPESSSTPAVICRAMRQSRR